jgi:esterase
MIACERIGNGDHKVLVLHGWFGDHAVWKPTYELLDTERFTYGFVDYRGYGASRAEGGPYTMAQISSDVRELAASLGWNRFSLVGHSMGGMAAQRVAIDAPDRVSAVVGVTPVPATGVPLPADIMAVFESAARDDKGAVMVIEGSLGQRLTPAVARLILRHTRNTVDAEVFAQYLVAFTKTDFSSESQKLTCPIKVLVGQHDGGVSEELVRGTFPKLYASVEIEVLPNAGHYPMIETPAYLVTTIEKFLSGKA